MKTAPGRNDNCWCGSGRKYKFCHHDIDSVSVEKKYAASQAVYARNWKSTAKLHYSDGIYHWLAEQISNFKPTRILDVGCGSGHGLVALRETLGPDTHIVAVDENRSCLLEASATMRASGMDACLIERVLNRLTPGGYDHVTMPLVLPSDSRCTLIEADICNDQHLVPALQASGQFDLVTIWLTGVHMLRQDHVDVRAKGIDSDSKHRLYVQNATYELADSILRPGGILQVADRGITPDEPRLREDLLRAHAEQASVTSLKVKTLAHRPYVERNSGRTPMRLSPGVSGEVPKQFQTSIVSILSEKL